MIRFGLSHQVSTRLLALLGAVSLAMTGELGAPALVVLAAAFIASFAGLRFRSHISIPRSTWNAATIVMFAFAVLDVLWISRSLLIGSIHFLIYLTIHKLLTLETSRDHLQLTLISFLHLMAASTLTTELSYVIIFLFYLIVAIWTLLLFNLRASAEAQGSPNVVEDLDRERVLRTPFVVITTAVGLFSFVLTFGIFFVIPRFGVGLMQKKPDEPIRTVGFSEKVNLGAIGSIKLDPTIIMRVAIPGKMSRFGEGLYYRGATFDTYDGRSWENGVPKSRILHRDVGGRLGFERRPSAPGETFTQRIELEPLDLPVLFAVSQVQAIGGGFTSLETDSAEVIRAPFPLLRPVEYTVTSRIPVLAGEEMGQADFVYPEEILSRYLRLPEGEEDVARLAQDITRDGRTSYEKIRLIQRYLISRYRYTLDVTPTPGVAPIDDFLFYRKTGFCEHYATAMTLMVRSLGIPARLATGFYGGEWNEFGNYYAIHKSDAHAWVEVYFPRAGWVTFDPTPAGIGGSTGIAWSSFARYVDAMKRKWKRYIIDYDINDQVQLVERVRGKGIHLREALDHAAAAAKAVWGEIVREARHRPAVIRAGLTVFCLAGLIFWVYLLRGRRAFGIFPRGSPPRDRVTTLYVQILNILATRGLPRPAPMTPREFVPQVRSAIPVPADILIRATEAYYAVRFGEVQPTDEMEGAMIALLQAIKGVS